MSKGHIRCARCDRVDCGCNEKYYISLYYQGKSWKFRHYSKDGMPLDYERAEYDLDTIRQQIYDKSFNPLNWAGARVKERQFEHQMRLFINEKEKEWIKGELAPETYRKYSETANRYFTFFKGKDVRGIGKELLHEFKNSLEGSIKYRKDILGIVNTFLKWLYRKDTITNMPFMPTIKGNDSKPKESVDYEDQIEILKKVPERFRDVVEFMMETGLRTGEVTALKVKDIRKEEAIIQRTWSGRYLKENTKTNQKKRIPLSHRALEILKDKGKFGNEFIFPYKPKTLQNMWRKLGMSVSLYEITRHSFCTQIAEMGINTLQAKKLMRHSDIRSTERYFHGSVSKLKNVVDMRTRSKIVTEMAENG